MLRIRQLGALTPYSNINDSGLPPVSADACRADGNLVFEDEGYCCEPGSDESSNGNFSCRRLLTPAQAQAQAQSQSQQASWTYNRVPYPGQSQQQVPGGYAQNMPPGQQRPMQPPFNQSSILPSSISPTMIAVGVGVLALVAVMMKRQAS